MSARETGAAAVLRFELLAELQAGYANFLPFLEDVMEHLGFDVTDIQEDIANFLEFGPQYLMIQAQRGQAKTTIVAAFAVWCLIHDPRFRVVVFSAGGTQASEISTLIVRIITGMDVLECLRPDRTAGDRTSVESFDVHHTLKGTDKSPALRCMGITANSQGARADLLIADDVESKKNSMTQLMRSQLLDLTKDFSSICTDGRIVYLGTPQSMDSIYNTLPGRGFTVRIWPGRYPTPDQMDHYGEHLAPLLRQRIRNNPSLQTGGGVHGDQGQPIDSRLNERVLQAKEQDQGPSYFQLQHMLNTTLSDLNRYPLKVDQLIFTKLPGRGAFPLVVNRGYSREHILSFAIESRSFTGYRAAGYSAETSALQGLGMFVDPAGGGLNADESAYAIVGFLNGFIWVLDVGGVPGGYSPTGFEELAAIAKRWDVTFVEVEKNMGNGAFLNAWRPYLMRALPKCGTHEEWSSGVKELRIIDTIEPVIARGALVINSDIVETDAMTIQKYPLAKRGTYSLFHQISRITRDRSSLQHDDRLDALYMGVRYWVKYIAINQDKAIKARQDADWNKWLSNPVNYRGKPPPKTNKSILSRFKR